MYICMYMYNAFHMKYYLYHLFPIRSGILDTQRYHNVYAQQTCNVHRVDQVFTEQRTAFLPLLLNRCAVIPLYFTPVSCHISSTCQARRTIVDQKRIITLPSPSVPHCLATNYTGDKQMVRQRTKMLLTTELMRVKHQLT